MILYFALMLLTIWAVLSVGLWKMASARAREVEHELNPVPRPGPRPKAVPPFPFGPISDLIKDAEHQAEEDFYATFPEERPHPIQQPPGGYSMDSSPNGIIVSNGVMTPNEWRERYQDQARLPKVIPLDENTTYRSLTSPPKMVDVESLGMGYARYIEGIGMIRAETRGKLDRACEVALMEKFRETSAAMRFHDAQIRAAFEVPSASIDVPAAKENRRDAWEKCKLYLDLLQQLNL